MPGVRVGLELARRGQLALQALVALDAFRERLQSRILDRQLAELRRAARDILTGEHPPDLLEAVEDLLQAVANGFLHGRRTAGAGEGHASDPWPTRAAVPLAVVNLGRGILRDVCGL